MSAKSDEQLREVAQRALDDTRGARAEPAAERFDATADQAGEQARAMAEKTKAVTEFQPP